MKLLRWCPYIVAIGLCSGCTTGGFVTGPFSKLAVESNRQVMMTRALHASQTIEPTKKQAVIRAMSFGCSPNEVVIGLGVDVLALTGGEYTGKELIKNIGGSLLDGVLYGGIAWGAGQISHSLSSADAGTVTVTGNLDNSPIFNIHGNSGPVNISYDRHDHTTGE